MAAPVNDRDVLIMGASPRFTAPSNSGMFVTPSTAIFKTASDGSNPLPSSFSFQATLLNLTGTVAWSWSTGLAPVVTGNSIALEASKMSVANGSITATITVDGKPYTQTVPISKVADGATGTPGVGTPGARGAGHWYTAGSSWSDTLASKACPGGPVVNDVVTISNNSSFVNEKYWDGSAWQQQGIVINGQLIVPLSITTTQIDARGLVIRDANGNPILGAGNALPAAYAAPGTLNSDLAPALASVDTAAARWDFTGTLNGFGQGNATLTQLANSITWQPTAANAYLFRSFSTSEQFSGASCPRVRARVRRTAGTGTWEGNLYYTTANHGNSGSYVKTIAAPADVTQWNILEWDMSALTAGGTDWTDNTITGIRIDLISSGADGTIYEIDWVAIGLFNSGISPSTVQAAGTTALWTNIATQPNAPASNATVGAPAGTSIAGTLAETVASNAAAGASANAAIPGINSSLSDKLSKTAASALQTQITLATSGAIAVGNASYGSAGFGGTGVVMTPYGLAGVNAGVPKFYIGTDGNSYFAGTLAAGIVKASNMVIGSPDNILPDPAFYDLTWWGRVGYAVGDYTGQSNAVWKNGRTMVIGANGGGAVRSSDSPFFPTTPGATYFVEIQVYLTNDFAGFISMFWNTPGDGLLALGMPLNSGTWSNGPYPGWPVHFNTNSPKGFFTFSKLITLSAATANSRARFSIVDQLTAGSCEFGSISMTRVTDATLLGPGIVQTKHLFLSQGGDISNGQTSYGVGNGFWMEGAGNGHGARMSMGNSATGQQFLCDPANGVLGLYGAALTNATSSGSIVSDALIASLSGSASGTGGPNGSRSYGTLTANPSRGRAPYRYSWSASDYASSGQAVGKLTMTDPTAQSVSFGGSGTNCTLDYKVVCVVTDANSNTFTLNTELINNHGTPQ